MAVLRDVVARLGMDFDGTGFKKADSSISGLTGGLNGIAIAMAAVGAALGSIRLVELGSDANETLNVLDASFGENSKSVQKWAESFATNVGRSEYTMREMAGTLGAVLTPLMGKNREESAKMSTRLSELSVDLRSFYNLASDTDAMNKLRAGITGEAEGLKRLGVVMNDVTLAQFMKDEGIKGSLKTMSIAEKTMLRYKFILDQTSDAHGDAAKTSEGWANMTASLDGALNELGTSIGLRMLPAAEKAVKWARNLARGFAYLVKKTEIVDTAMVLLGGAAVVMATKMLVAFAPLIIKFVLIGAAVALVILVVEDFLALLAGKDSVIGDFINMLYGPGSAEEAVANLKLAFEGLTLYMRSEVFPAWQSLDRITSNWIDNFFDSFMESTSQGLMEFKKFGDEVVRVLKKIASFLDTGMLKALGSVGSYLGLDVNKLKSEYQDAKTAVSEGLSDIWQGYQDFGKDMDDFYSGKWTPAKGWFDFGLDASVDAGAAEAGRVQFNRENEVAIRANPLLAQNAGSQGRDVINKMSQELNVNVTGMSDDQAAKKIAKEIAKETKKATKKTMKAVTQRAE